ncbi:hypothetical protein Xoosp13_384 [Xanthomonas phage Xoo-sp13]|nr:hypothetical protein Xoosp13_384 [Xanthomonas phage Xoo-sp13]
MAPDILTAITVATLELIDDRNLVYSGLTHKFYYNHSESLTPEEFLKSVEDDYRTKEAKLFVNSPQQVLPKLTLCEKFLKLFQKKKAG